MLRSLTRKATRTDRAAKALADLADSGPLAEAAAKGFGKPARRLPGFTAPAVALLGGLAVVATAALTDFGGPWPLVAAVAYVLTSALAVARPSRAPSTGWSRPSSAPPSTAPSWCSRRKRT